MRKSTKGALAAAAAAVLLMGGFGTHAAWNDDAEVPGGAISTGHLNLTGSCGDWDLVNGLTSTTFTDATLTNLFMVPGDVLSRLCTFTVNIKGANLANATLSFGPAPLVKDGVTTLTDLDASATFTEADGTTPILDGATVADNQVIKAKLSVELAAGLTGLQGQDLAGLLDSLTVTITQA
ncbi:alternate-type signal peptide domain-containing protein [Nocardioides sp.]|uniref:alternate-type signal peptide domain-containing protein n=1 Tax=Nocardioides sp. TaxID=35761 RepID=UPI002ED9D556